jgi:glyoxalase family protein
LPYRPPAWPGVGEGKPQTRLGEATLTFTDHDGTHLALTAVDGVQALPGHDQGDVPGAHAIRGIHGVTLWVEQAGPTAAVLSGPLDFQEAGSETSREETRHRFIAPGQLLGSVIDLRVVTGLSLGRMGRGSVHHVAFRASSDAEQALMAKTLRNDLMIGTTEQKDRNYFRSVYFREPSGVIFEIATDDPGFAVDESPQALGEKLMLPPWLEPRRAQVEAALPVLNLR